MLFYYFIPHCLQLRGWNLDYHKCILYTVLFSVSPFESHNLECFSLPTYYSQRRNFWPRTYPVSQIMGGTGDDTPTSQRGVFFSCALDTILNKKIH